MGSNAETAPAPDDDFGHIVACRPHAVARPTTLEQLVELVTSCRRNGIAVNARGAGHSVFGQSQIHGGQLVDMTAMRQVRVEHDIAIAEAGATWSDVVRTTVAVGLTPAVLTDYIGLTVGGTLSVGGIGPTSFRFGSQTDQVRKLSVVTGAGDVRMCSATQERELFDAVRAGLGQVGIISEAELQLVQAPSHVRHYRIPYAGLTDLLLDLDRLAAERRMDQISAVGVIDSTANWHFHIDGVVELSGGFEPDDGSVLAGLRCSSSGTEITDLPYLSYCTRLDAVVADWHNSGLWHAPHPWVDVFVSGPKLLQLAETTISSLTPESLGVDGAMLLIYPIAASRASTPMLPIPTTSERAYLFDVLRCTPGASPTRIEQLLGENRHIYEQALELGGALYPISAVAMNSGDWQRHFGEHWAALSSAKHRYDPEGVFGGHCRIFG